MSTNESVTFYRHPILRMWQLYYQYRVIASLLCFPLLCMYCIGKATEMLHNGQLKFKQEKKFWISYRRGWAFVMWWLVATFVYMISMAFSDKIHFIATCAVCLPGMIFTILSNLDDVMTHQLDAFDVVQLSYLHNMWVLAIPIVYYFVKNRVLQVNGSLDLTDHSWAMPPAVFRAHELTELVENQAAYQTHNSAKQKAQFNLRRHQEDDHPQTVYSKMQWGMKSKQEQQELLSNWQEELELYQQEYDAIVVPNDVRTAEWEKLHMVM